MTNNKEIIKKFFDSINANEFKEAFEFFDEELDWWILGSITASGHKDKKQISLGLKLLKRAFSQFQFILHEMTEEKERVSVVAESKAEHKNGKKYNNHYHFLFTMKNGKIYRVKEFLDTEHARWVEEP